MYVVMRQSRAVLGVLTNLGKRFSLTVATVAESGRENGGKSERLGWAQRYDGWDEDGPGKRAFGTFQQEYFRSFIGAARPPAPPCPPGISVTLGRLSSNINDLTFTSQRVIYVGRL